MMIAVLEMLVWVLISLYMLCRIIEHHGYYNRDGLQDVCCRGSEC